MQYCFITTKRTKYKANPAWITAKASATPSTGRQRTLRSVTPEQSETARQSAHSDTAIRMDSNMFIFFVKTRTKVRINP